MQAEAHPGDCIDRNTNITSILHSFIHPIVIDSLLHEKILHLVLLKDIKVLMLYIKPTLPTVSVVYQNSMEYHGSRPRV